MEYSIDTVAGPLFATCPRVERPLGVGTAVALSLAARGVIIEPRHELFGVCFAGKILVFPSAKGSSGWSGFFQTTRLSGTAPIGMVIGRISAKSALGAVVTRVPAITDLDADPCEVIATGDWLLLDNSTVEVTKR